MTICRILYDGILLAIIINQIKYLIILINNYNDRI